MRKFLGFKILGLLLLLFLGSCSDKIDTVNSAEVGSRESLPTRAAKLDGKYYPIVPNTTEWESFTTGEEMWQACQLTELQLHGLSNEELIDACLEFPLAYNYTAFDDQKDGISMVIEGFNGLQELIKREEGPSGLLSAYKSLDYSSRELMVDRINQSLGLTLGYVELLLTDDRILKTFNQEQLKELGKAAQEKYMMKLSHLDYFGLMCVKHSLMVCAEVKLLDGTNYSEEERKLLASFTHLFPVTTNKVLENITNLLFNRY